MNGDLEVVILYNIIFMYWSLVVFGLVEDRWGIGEVIGSSREVEISWKYLYYLIVLWLFFEFKGGFVNMGMLYDRLK